MSNKNEFITEKNYKPLTKYIKELSERKCTTGNNVSEIKREQICTIAINVSPTAGTNSFNRNPFFAAEFCTFFQQCYTFFNDKPYYLDIRQNHNLIIVILSCPNDEQFNSIYKYINDICQMTGAITKYLTKINVPCNLSFRLALDCDYNCFLEYENKKYLWLGDNIRRVEWIVSDTDSKEYPNLLLTNSAYQKLLPEYQDTFPKAFYIRHIACYGREISFTHDFSL